MKRRRSPSPPSSSVRRRPPPTPEAGLTPLFALDELFLRVLSFLDARDLARVQRVSRHWGRMSLDPQLWKQLYLERYPHPHRSKVVYSRSRSATPLRPISRLPSRAFPPPSPSLSPSSSPTPERDRNIDNDADNGHSAPRHVRNDGIDWKIMMRLGTNWANGNVLAEASVPLPQTQPRGGDEYSQHRIALFPGFICTSSLSSPLVHVYTATGGDALGIVPPPPGWSTPARPDTVVALCADQSVVPAPNAGETLPARLAIMYASGGFAVVRLRLVDSRLAWTRESVCNTRSRPRRRAHGQDGRTHAVDEGDRVVFAAMHYPSLVTCTRGFLLSIYSLAEGTPLLLGALRSDVSFHPAALVLFPDEDGPSLNNANPNPSTSNFRAALTYCTPVYPSSWTIAIQELAIDTAHAHISRGECYRVSSTINKDHWPRRVQPLVGVRGKAVGVGTDGRWCVLAGDDSVIHVYALPGGEDADIAHAQTLLAPSAGVTSLALAAGRCVTGGRDGRVLVWELDEGAEVGDGEGEGEGKEGEARVGRVAGYVEVKAGSRRARGRDESPSPSATSEEGGRDELPELPDLPLPHPAAISAAARSMFLAAPPAALRPAQSTPSRSDSPSPGDSPAIRQLAFDEERIVGLVDGPAGGDVMRVWSFS